ncbi:hypothetical protein OY671_013008, partial [Metschnikowia pulcherrima]
GRWQVGGRTSQSEQQYQMSSGKLGSSEISDARMDGRTISFTADGVRYPAEVNATTIQGSAAGKGEWSARRI